MKRSRHRLALALVFASLAACGGSGGHEGEHSHDHETEALDTGTRGGRLLTEGDFTLEVLIFERGVPPEFRVFAQRGGKAIPADQLQVTITLERVNGLPAGRTVVHALQASGDYLRSRETVEEPHSFTATVTAVYGQQTFRWRYDSPEGQVSIAAPMASANGLASAEVGPGVIRETFQVYGTISPDPQRIRRVGARYPGVVRSVKVQLGDQVRAGQTLAMIESDESLQTYSLEAPIAGTVTLRGVEPGEHSGSAAIFEVVDLSRVTAELSIFPRDRGRLRVGQAVEIVSSDGDAVARGVLGFVTATSAANQSLTARVALENRDGRWTPGQFVAANVFVGEVSVALAVPPSAVQPYRGGDAVFVNVGELYQALPVVLGKRDTERVEILEGLEPGARVVVANSFLVKADIEKSGAAHDH